MGTEDDFAKSLDDFDALGASLPSISLRSELRSPGCNKDNDSDLDDFRIIKTHVEGNFTIVLVYYAFSKNHKILVFEGVHKTQNLKRRKRLDHFSNSKLSPIARFNPNDAGWNYALVFCKNA